MNEQEWDKKLNIDTIGRDASKEDEYHYPYEPTPYSVLERLGDSGYIGKENIVVDYGCGKGRVAIFLNNQLGCNGIGVDFDERMISDAIDNLDKNHKSIAFQCISAEQYEIENADSFYFLIHSPLKSCNLSLEK